MEGRHKAVAERGSGVLEIAILMRSPQEWLDTGPHRLAKMIPGESSLD